MYFGLQTFKEKEDCLKSLNVANQGIILPIASAVWQVGGSYDVIWNSSVFGDKVSIALTNVDNNKVCDFDGITNTGNYRFTVPVKTGFGSCDDGSNLPGRYQITVWTKAVTLKSEIFSVVASATQPSITVTSPNGGEVWKVGETQTIKYIASNIPKTATCIDAFAVDSVGKEAPLFLGSYIFMITDSTLTFKLGVGDSNNIIPGDYKIKLDVHACAETNNTPITSGTSLGFIKIVTNSEFIKPSLSQITPSQGNKNNTVTIYGSNLSDVSGIMMTPAGRSLGYTACTNIISKSQNSITFNFTSGFCDLSGLYKVSVISSTGQSNLLDFEFVSVSAQSSITVTSPNGGETWAKGSTQTITWNPVGLSNDSKVAISLTIGGANPIFFASNIPSNSGTYSWTIPNALLAGSQCKIGISDSTPGITKPNIAEDLSDNYFTISTATTIPFISSIFPTSGYNGIELYGSRFTSDTRIRFVKNGFVYIVDSDKISFDLSSHVLPNRIRWTFDGMLGEGLYEISLINSNGISNSVNFNLTSSDQLLHPSLYVKRLFPGQYDNTKYEVRISGISLSGLSDVAVNKAGGGKLMVGSPRDGTAPCSSSTSTVTVTLLPSDFPLTGTVVECKSSTVYPVKAQMPSL
jgi:hypothetical protein